MTEKLELESALGFSKMLKAVSVSGTRKLTLFTGASAAAPQGAVLRWHRGEGPDRAGQEHRMTSILLLVIYDSALAPEHSF